MQELGIFFVATLLISGVMPGVFRAFHKVLGYSNRYVDRDSEGYLDIGRVPLFILKTGIGSLIGGMIVSEGPFSKYTTFILGILIGGGLACIHSMIVWFLASAHRFNYGLIGAGIGLLFGVIIGAIGSDLFLFRREALATIFDIVSSAGGSIFGGVLGIRIRQSSSSRLAAEIAGTMILGRGIGGLMVIFCEGEIGEVIFIVSSYALLGELLGGGVVIILIMVATLSRVIFIGLSFLLILTRFKAIICDNCLRYTQPLKSQYSNGIRYCEHCHAELERTSEPGKVIFLFGQFNEFQMQALQAGDKRRFIILNPMFGDTQQKPENGLYLRSKVDLDRKECPVDVSEVYIDTKTSDRRLVERFITYIVNYPPAGGIGSVQIFYRGEMSDLGGNLNNALRNNFVYLERV